MLLDLDILIAYRFSRIASAFEEVGCDGQDDLVLEVLNAKFDDISMDLNGDQIIYDQKT